jgi:hypothetical protein
MTGGLDELADPTTQTSLADTAATADRKSLPIAGSGMGTTLHAVPFQCSASVWNGEAVDVSDRPDIVGRHAGYPVSRSVPPVPGFGLATTVQAQAAAAPE